MHRKWRNFIWFFFAWKNVVEYNKLLKSKKTYRCSQKQIKPNFDEQNKNLLYFLNSSRSSRNQLKSTLAPCSFTWGFEECTDKQLSRISFLELKSNPFTYEGRKYTQKSACSWFGWDTHSLWRYKNESFRYINQHCYRE